MELVSVLAQREAKAASVEHSTVHKPHRGDEADSSKHADGREVFLGIHAVVLEQREGHCVGQSQRGHVKRYAQRVNGDKRNLVRLGIGHTHVGKSNHRHASDQVADTQQALGLDVLVGHNAHESRHEN